MLSEKLIGVAHSRGVFCGNLAILAIVVCTSVCVGVGLAYSLYVSDKALLAGSSGGLAVGALALIVRDVARKRFEIHNLKYYFLTGYFCFLGLGGLQAVLSGSISSHKGEVVFKTVSMSYLGLLSFLAGNAMGGNRRTPGQKTLGIKVSSRFITVYGVAICVLAMIGMFGRFELYGGIVDFAVTPYHLKHSGGSGENVWRVLGRLYVPAIAFLMYFALSKGSSRATKIFVSAVLFVLYLCCSIQGARGGVLQFWFVSVCSVYLFGTRTLRRFMVYVMPLAVAVGFAFVVQSKYRQNPEGFLYLTGEEIYYGLEDVMSNFGAYGHFMTVVETFPSQYNFTWGGSIYNIATNFIPRELWGGKPVGFGKFVASEMYGAPEIVSYASTIVGEAYANGSWVGICVILAGLGFVGRMAYNSVEHGRHGVLSVAFYVVLVWPFFFIVRGDMLSAVFPVVSTYTCMLVLFWSLVFLGRIFRGVDVKRIA